MVQEHLASACRPQGMPVHLPPGRHRSPSRHRLNGTLARGLRGTSRVSGSCRDASEQHSTELRRLGTLAESPTVHRGPCAQCLDQGSLCDLSDDLQWPARGKSSHIHARH